MPAAGSGHPLELRPRHHVGEGAVEVEDAGGKVDLEAAAVDAVAVPLDDPLDADEPAGDRGLLVAFPEADARQVLARVGGVGHPRAGQPVVPERLHHDGPGVAVVLHPDPPPGPGELGGGRRLTPTRSSSSASGSSATSGAGGISMATGAAREGAGRGAQASGATASAQTTRTGRWGMDRSESVPPLAGARQRAPASAQP